MKQFSLFDKAPDEKSVPTQLPDKVPSTGSSGKVAQSVRPLTELSFDIEATGSNPLVDTVVGISLCREKGKAFYVPIRHTQGPNVQDAPAVLKEVLEDASIAKIGHNLKYDILILRQEGIRVRGPLFDTMVAAYLLNPNKPGHSLEETGLEYLMHRKRSFTEVLGKRKSFADVPPDEATPYAAEDAALAMELKEILFSRLRDEGLDELYAAVEMPLITLLADMEQEGIRLDTRRLEGLSKELEGELALLQDKIYTLAGGPFNINSPKQLGKVLFEDLGLKPRKKTKTGFSTGVDVLEDLAREHELPGEILNYRTLYKLKTTYADTLPALADPRRGRLHTSFNQTVTATGRLSSSEPNLQNIPVRGDWGRKIREAFIADDGYVLLSSDYSQVELRILAHMSGDEGLAEAFRNGIDIHTKTAAELFAIPKEEVTSDMRRIAKVVNFGVIYGMSAYGLSESLSISPREAGAYIDNYFEQHGGVRDYMKETIRKAREQGFVTTLLGRKRPVPEILSPNSNVRQQAERLAVNTPIQGTAADLIKKAMLSVADAFRKEGLHSRMLLQIHDELLFEVPAGELEKTRETVRREMENALLLSIPLKVDMGWGMNWAEAH